MNARDGRRQRAERVSGWVRAGHANRAASGGTRWLRFGLTLGASAAVSGVLVVGMAQGAIAASFAASGTAFKVNAESLDGKGLIMYGSEVKSSAGAKQAATMGIKSGKIDSFCTGLTVTELPLLGKVTIGLESPEIEGENLVLDVGKVDAGTLSLSEARMGLDASNVGGVKGSSGLDAAKVRAEDLTGDTWSLSAGTMTAHEMTLSADVGDEDSCE